MLNKYKNQDNMFTGYKIIVLIILFLITSVTISCKKNVNKAPSAVIEASLTKGNIPFTVFFDGQKSSDPENSKLSYFWTINDGISAANLKEGSAAIFQYDFVKAGSFTVTLTVTDNKDNKNSTSVLVTASDPAVVANVAPVADFLVDVSQGYFPLKVNFNAYKAYDVDGQVKKYIWNFGDGSAEQTMTDSKITHTFVNKGEFIVKLIVEDDKGTQNFKTLKITTNDPNQDPVAKIISNKIQGLIPLEITFNASESRDPEKQISNYQWNFGDGTTTTTADPILSHTYNVEGVFNASVTVVDSKGKSSVASITITAIDPNKKPVAAVDSNIQTGMLPLVVTFSAGRSHDLDGNIVNYAWNFGDGKSVAASTSPTIIHTFENIGTYNTVLTVTDNLGKTATDNIQIVVSNVQNYAPKAFIVPNLIEGVAPFTIDFNKGNSYDIDGEIVKYTFYFADGTNQVSTNGLASHQYTRGGNYDTYVVAEDNIGAQTISAKVRVLIKEKPVARFNINPDYAGPAPFEITMDASSSFDPDGTIVEYCWNFGDGNINQCTTEKIIKHVYTTNAKFNVTLTVKDNHGLTNILTNDVIIERPGNIILSNPTIEGYDCSGASVTLSPDKQQISVLFNNYTATINDGTDTTSTYKRSSCNIAIPVKVPAGKSITLYNINYRGYYYAPAGVIASFHAEHFFAGNSFGENISQSWGNSYSLEEGNYYLSRSVEQTSEVWSKCGDDVILRSNTSIAINDYGSAYREYSYINLDSLDLSGAITYHIKVRNCPNN
ncbi:MAG: PKD domain-containing protein [Oligoflexia bacterium]|nr:PKD domain-containing protein [Oligoflexia bacterium]